MNFLGNILNNLKQRAFLVFLLTLVAFTSKAQLFPSLGSQRAGIASFTNLKIDVSPRAVGLAGAITTMKGDAYASQWNPATLTELNGHSFAAATKMYPQGVSHSFAAANIRLRETDYIAVSVNNLYSGQMEVRTEFQPNGTGQFFAMNSMAIGVSYAKALTYKFSVGTTIKYLNETADVFTASSVAVDVGFIYKTDYKNLRFGVFLQNFGPNSMATGNYNPFNFTGKQLATDGFSTPTVFKFGTSMVPYKKDLHSIAVAAELNHPGDNSSCIRLGAEYNYSDLLFFRAGYGFNLHDYTAPTAGVGLRTVVKSQVLHLNYAFAMMNAWGVNHNIGLSVLLHNPKHEKIEE